MKRLISHPLFGLGLLIRLGLLTLVLPRATSLWYAPFLDITTGQPTLDPWRLYLEAGGAEAAFPYGYVMWLICLPLTLVCRLLGLDVAYGYGLTLIVADFGLLLALRGLLGIRDRLLLACYWLSPIVLFATYWLGLNDLIPVVLLCLALCCMRALRPIEAGLLCGAAISAKLSMVLAIPFFGIYLFGNRALRTLLPAYLKGLGFALAAFCLPFAASSAGRDMLFGNPEMTKVYEFALHIGDHVQVYVLPLAYLLMLYAAWRVRRMSFDQFVVLSGLAFFLVVLLTPASPGWFIWIMPLLMLYQSRSGPVAMALVGGFAALYLVSGLLTMPAPAFAGRDDIGRAAIEIGQMLGPRGAALLHTLILAAGLVLMLRVWRQAIRSDDYFRRSREPFAIGIAGDSGAGKDTLADSLQGLFGSHSVVKLSGDDYHLWDRHRPMWQVMTHLNPMANDLERYAQDLIALTDGKTILSRHYDHATGKMSRPRRIASNDFIIASGLHALYLPILRDSYDLSIYLDIDEDLRRHFKIQRDVHQRGHSLERVLTSLAARQADTMKFVRPQIAHADLVLSLQPLHPRAITEAEAGHPIRCKLFVRSRQGLNEVSLARVLIGLCGLHVELTTRHDSNEVEMTVEGETSAEDIALAARMLFPDLADFLDTKPRWEDGVGGLMQLVTLSHIDQAMHKRLI